MARGRTESAAVSRYLEALGGPPAKRGRRRSEETIRARLATIADELKTANALQRLHLLQERKNLNAELEEREQAPVPITELEEAFVKFAASYGERHKIAWNTWREVGVPAATLRRAGVKPRS